ncbi:MAG: glycine betaine ABC transporter substrate-binding protein [Gracilimonas sp.]|uniref:glycine betaine ABC transporter substrate-binding protein n=1 Tax=Gracilimonas sp. TaxID=1974203 RepID=UPI0019B93F97|nr:glycine betaine ABC transporter substrate-binding protein [Gracilimonas sp.]MBD3615110.1 glycine betaine ABC transporter substrate-binding protein [Gracilimonas sp.]
MEWAKLISGRQLLVGLLGLLIVGGALSCNKADQKEEEQTIRLIYANWSEGVAMTYLVAEILESQLGYEVATKMTDIESVFEQLGNGEYDVFVDAWLPGTHGEYMEQYGAQLEDLGVNVNQVRTGLMVPDYIEAQSISDLEGSMSEIIGIGSGAGIMASTQRALEAYNLSLNLLEGSEETMTETLVEAIKRREPIVVTGWTPHWIYNRYDLKFLDDPQNIYGESEKIHTIARKNFTTEHARASLFFERFDLTEEQLGALMDEVETFPDNERRAVRNWIKENEFIVNRWVRGLQPEREKVM